jgi:hypothetical protein
LEAISSHTADLCDRLAKWDLTLSTLCSHWLAGLRGKHPAATEADTYASLLGRICHQLSEFLDALGGVVVEEINADDAVALKQQLRGEYGSQELSVSWRPGCAAAFFGTPSQSVAAVCQQSGIYR